jgi:glycosyltransferase involved in cell wall biosynthesis
MKVLGVYSWTSYWSMGPRSGAISFFLASHAYVQAGHEIHVSMPHGKGLPFLENEDGVVIHRYRGAIRFDSNPRHPVPVRLTSRVLRYAYYLLIGTWAGVRLGRKIRPDLVIGYGVQSAVVASFVARLLGRPNITRLFGLQLHLFLKNRWKLPGAFMEIFGIKAPCRYLIIHDDGSQGDRIARGLGVPPEKIRFWRDGIEPTLYRPGEQFPELRRRLGIPGDHVILFCVGRLSEDKKMGRLIEILPEIVRQEPKVSLMLVGDGPERALLEQDASERGVRSNVCLTGAVSREELPGYLNLGDIFVGVSDRTNVNLSPIEAMSCAKAMVVLDAGGTRTLIQHEVSGILVPLERWREELPQALLDLIGDPARRDSLGRAARETVLRRIPTLEERRRMEAELGEQAVREFEAERARRAPPRLA